MQSILMTELDENEKIVKLEAKWNEDDQPTKLGAWVSNSLRTLQMITY